MAIWRPTDDTPLIPLRTPFGLMADSIEAEFADTGWVDIEIASGFAANSASEKPQVRRFHDIVMCRGAWNSTGVTAAGIQVIGTMPAGFRPTHAVIGWAGTATAAQAASLRINPGGSIDLRAGTSISPYFFLNGSHSWPSN